LRDFDIAAGTLAAFVRSVANGYKARPFHNFSHAVYVLHAATLFFNTCPLVSKVLKPLDRLALGVAALGHDVGHTGTNNAFLISSHDPLALQYNDKSVLENHHCSLLFRVMQRQGCAILATLDNNDYREVRKTVIGGILATDLAQHFGDMSKFKTRAQSGQEWVDSEPADRLMLLEMVLHAADLSGPARPWDVSAVWSSKV